MNSSRPATASPTEVAPDINPVLVVLPLPSRGGGDWSHAAGKNRVSRPRRARPPVATGASPGPGRRSARRGRGSLSGASGRHHFAPNDGPHRPDEGARRVGVV